jgi:glycerol-3-phosphate cytidylyltransferase
MRQPRRRTALSANDAGFGELRKARPLMSSMTSRTVLTYGSFDRFHQGHARLLQRLSMMGSELIVGCSTDEYNARMGLPAVTPYAQRRLMLESCRFVSRVIAEQEYEQKYTDIINYNVSVFAMGEDWTGQFDHFGDITRVVYVPRAQIIAGQQPVNHVTQPALRVASSR